MIFSAAVTGDSLVRIFLFHTLIRPPAQTSGCWRPKALQTLATPPPSGFTEFIHRPRFETSLPGWWCPTRGARRGWAAGLTGNKLSSETLQRAIFTSKQGSFSCSLKTIRLLLRGRSHNQLTVQGRPKSPTNSGERPNRGIKNNSDDRNDIWSCSFKQGFRTAKS